MTTQVDTPVDHYKFVADGFRSVDPELLDLSTPELLKSEMDGVIAAAKKSNLDSNSTFNLAKKKATDLLNAFRAYHQIAQNREARIQRKQVADIEATHRKEVAAQAKVELEHLVTELETQPTLTDAQRSSLKYFRLVYLEDKRDIEISNTFQGTTRDQRYQWKKRAIDMIEPLASPIAKLYISERTKRKFASFDKIVKCADIFLYKTMETK